MPPRRTTPELDALIGLFYAQAADLGDFDEISADAMPSIERVLLDHDQHMTLTIEAHHGAPVDVRVLEKHTTSTHYARKILLTRRWDEETVQFGIVRLHLDSLAPAVRGQIESQSAPLGTILIQHNVLRMVRLLSLWKIRPHQDLQDYFKLTASTTCYGRTALIYCNTVPAVELLEVVRPPDSFVHQ